MDSVALRRVLKRFAGSEVAWTNKETNRRKSVNKNGTENGNVAAESQCAD